MFKNLAIDNDVVQEDEADRIPQARRHVAESDVYGLRVDLAYMEKSAGGALALKLTLKEYPFENFTINETYWLTGGDAKGNKNYYVDKNTGKKKLIPGMAQANHIAELLTGKPLSEADIQEKVVKMWSFDDKKEIPTKVNAVVDLIGVTFQGGVRKKVENRRAKDAEGNWGPGPEKREFNYVDKYFTEDGLTLVEQKAGATSGTFLNTWKEKYKDTIEDTFDASIKGPDLPQVPNSVTETPALFT